MSAIIGAIWYHCEFSRRRTSERSSDVSRSSAPASLRPPFPPFGGTHHRAPMSSVGRTARPPPVRLITGEGKEGSKREERKEGRREGGRWIGWAVLRADPCHTTGALPPSLPPASALPPLRPPTTIVGERARRDAPPDLRLRTTGARTDRMV